MQIVGIGFSSHDWNTLVEQLHIHISRQLNTKLYEVANSASETKNWLKDTENEEKRENLLNAANDMKILDDRIKLIYLGDGTLPSID